MVEDAVGGVFGEAVLARGFAEQVLLIPNAASGRNGLLDRQVGKVSIPLLQ
jgi:hypothetical protein